MPIPRPVRSLAAALLVVATLLGVAPAPAAALEPPRPLPDHRPAFVTETDTRPWIDCLWASASMLLDKWTNGEVLRTHGQLRRLSGDPGGGSSFEDMRVAFRKLGFRITLDGDGDSTLTWGQFLSRLRNGAGAVVLGDYSDLPRYFGRWDYGFWRKKGKADNHAIYVERYDPRRGRVWLMDPLGRDGWQGEWMSIAALRQFAWFSGGRVQAIATPTARPAPFAGVQATNPRIGLSTEAITATWSLRVPRRWRYAGADVHVSVKPAADPIVAAAVSAVVNPRTTGDAAPKQATAGVSGRTLRASAALPTKPGAYVVGLSLTDRRFGDRFVTSDPVSVFVPDLRRAALRVRTQERLPEVGQRVPVTVAVANPSGITWADTVSPNADEREDRSRNTRLVGTWVRLDTSTDGTPDAEIRRTVDLGPIALEPGRHTRVGAMLAVPAEAGHWALVVDVVDDIDGSFAARGSAPAVAIFRVLPKPVIEGVE